MSEIIQVKTKGRQQEGLPACVRYNLSFSFDKSKDRYRCLARNIEPVHHEQSMADSKSTCKEVDTVFMYSSFGPFKTSRSPSCQQSPKCLPSSSGRHAEDSQETFSLSRSGFPQRKKRSGEQQLLNLLLKCADKLALSSQHQQQLRKVHGPLFDENVQTHQRIIPKLRYRTRFNWSKGQESPSRGALACSGRDPVIKGLPVLSGKYS